MTLAVRVSREPMSGWLKEDRGSLKHLRGSETWMVMGVVNGESSQEEKVVVKIFPEGTVIDETSVYDHKIHPMREGKKLFVQPLYNSPKYFYFLLCPCPFVPFLLLLVKYNSKV